MHTNKVFRTRPICVLFIEVSSIQRVCEIVQGRIKEDMQT